MCFQLLLSIHLVHVLLGMRSVNLLPGVLVVSFLLCGLWSIYCLGLACVVLVTHFFCYAAWQTCGTLFCLACVWSTLCLVCVWSTFCLACLPFTFFLHVFNLCTFDQCLLGLLVVNRLTKPTGRASQSSDPIRVPDPSLLGLTTRGPEFDVPTALNSSSPRGAI